MKRREIKRFAVPVVDLFLDGSGGDESVDSDRSRLTNPPRPLARLHVRAGVPVRVKDNHPVGARQIDPKTPDTSGQQKHIKSCVLKQQMLLSTSPNTHLFQGLQ